ncbi:MAG: S49 family peptidase, partial [Proteobacteria bacterium]|nr:S49 family peptidase [Pseudomonadota bacterium]
MQVIPIVGVIANRTQSLGVGALQLGEVIDQAASSSRVDAIVLDIDSPGGTVTGVPELAEKIFAARPE